MGLKILAINPGSTSTKCALYDDSEELSKVTIAHSLEELSRFRRLQDQLQYRSLAVRRRLLEASEGAFADIRAVVGRGGLLKPLSGGVYEVNERMKSDLAACKYGIHASNLGALIADSIATELGVKAYIVDPVVVDELAPVARFSGVPEIPRRSIFHALNQKATARKAARSIGKSYEECVLIVAHMGGGTSIGIHVRGRVVDVNNALDGEGPFSIERAGTVPAGDWMRWVLAHQHDQAALQRKLTGQGGLVAYLGTNDFPSIERSADAEGGLDGALCHGLIDALCYQVAKSIAALSAFTCGRIDAIVLTGGIASSGRAVREISNRVSFLAPVMVFPGENELEALAMGVREVLMGHSSALTYQG